MEIYEMIRQHMTDNVPFAGYIGVELVELNGERGVARLSKRPEVENHIQTMHAGAMFTLGEAASGAAMGGLLADQLLAARPVAANASIKYVKTAKTDIKAIATASIPAEDALKAFHADGKVVFDVHVDIRDADENTCAEMTVAWHIKKLG
ncbi:YiiD C-terminal domain-containing protein [Maricaulis sp.]|uniref:PaaI family thioesterase n=1 Tax=Maricaulis sp. TaxID=1486257 RepID=UPI0026231F4F|nr:YiiD C-terminal domain-containing protein [Maricaulis sp.]